MADREDVIRKVQVLWRKADDPASTPAEREACVAKAKELMAKYVIDEMVIEENRTDDHQTVIMADVRLTRNDRSSWAKDQRMMLGNYIAMTNRCRCVIMERQSSVNALTGKPEMGGVFITIVGFRSDVEMVRELYGVLSMDLVDSAMAEPTDHMKQREKDNYLANFAEGFVARVYERLRQINRKVESEAEKVESSAGQSMALVLRNRSTAVEDFFTKSFPNLRSVKVRNLTVDPNARQRGRAAADRSDLGQTKVGPSAKGELRE